MLPGRAAVHRHPPPASRPFHADHRRDVRGQPCFSLQKQCRGRLSASRQSPQQPRKSSAPRS